ncbi:MAG: transposase [Chloroflexi bacterium]|nr:transposase [Chloroflexota bacterium]
MSAATTPTRKVTGRKRHILVDTLGTLLRAVVHPADLSENEGGRRLLTGRRTVFTRLTKLWTDQGYKAAFVAWVEAHLGWSVEVVQKPPEQTTFVVLPRRRVVERTLAWLNRHRHLSTDPPCPHLLWTCVWHEADCCALRANATATQPSKTTPQEGYS